MIDTSGKLFTAVQVYQQTTSRQTQVDIYLPVKHLQVSLWNAPPLNLSDSDEF